jgi:hypothetical protein
MGEMKKLSEDHSLHGKEQQVWGCKMEKVLGGSGVGNAEGF